jgi:hypothetical protein
MVELMRMQGHCFHLILQDEFGNFGYLDDLILVLIIKLLFTILKVSINSIFLFLFLLLLRVR